MDKFRKKSVEKKDFFNGDDGIEISKLLELIIDVSLAVALAISLPVVITAAFSANFITLVA